jgi:hypothetical protein
MKTSSSRQDISRSKSNRKGGVIDKENQPLNAYRPHNHLQGGRKIGLEIRSRIHKTNNQGLTEIPLIENQLISSELPKLRKSESLTITGPLKRTKSVSFDENERGVSASIDRQNSKKSILKKSMGLSKQIGSLQVYDVLCQRSQISLANSHVNNQDQSIEHNVGNKVITDKY